LVFQLAEVVERKVLVVPVQVPVFSQELQASSTPADSQAP
jgi:hypothetical protein